MGRKTHVDELFYAVFVHLYAVLKGMRDTLVSFSSQEMARENDLCRRDKVLFLEEIGVNIAF